MLDSPPDQCGEYKKCGRYGPVPARKEQGARNTTHPHGLWGYGSMAATRPEVLCSAGVPPAFDPPIEAGIAVETAALQPPVPIEQLISSRPSPHRAPRGCPLRHCWDPTRWELNLSRSQQCRRRHARPTPRHAPDGRGITHLVSGIRHPGGRGFRIPNFEFRISNSEFRRYPRPRDARAPGQAPSE